MKKGRCTTVITINKESEMPEQSPLQEFIDQLPEWDGVKRIDNFLVEMKLDPEVKMELKGCKRFIAVPLHRRNRDSK